MIKYLPDTVSVVFEEIPDMVTLMVELSECQNHCVGCHSPWLRDSVGEELTSDVLRDLLEKNKGINCFLFSGEGNDWVQLVNLARVVKEWGDKSLKVAVYSGRDDLNEGDEADLYCEVFDYIKLGPYIEKFGPLNSKTTNQRLYKKEPDCRCMSKIGGQYRGDWVDITDKFWKRNEAHNS